MSARPPSNYEMGRLMAAMIGKWLLFGAALACNLAGWRVATVVAAAGVLAAGAVALYAMGPLLRWVYSLWRAAVEDGVRERADGDGAP